MPATGLARCCGWPVISSGRGCCAAERSPGSASVPGSGSTCTGPLPRRSCTQSARPAEMQVWRQALRDGGLFLDVGANVGAYTIWAAECGAEVIALEPAADTFGLLLENIALNDYQVRAIQAAAGPTAVPPGSPQAWTRVIALIQTASRDRAGHDRLADRRSPRGRHEGRCRGFRDRRAPRLHPRAVRAPHRTDAARMGPRRRSLCSEPTGVQ